MQTDMQSGLNIKHKTYSYSSETDGKKKVHKLSYWEFPSPRNTFFSRS